MANVKTMDPVIILVIIAVLLLIYQVAFKQDEDKLDQHGHPVRKRRSKGFNN